MKQRTIEQLELLYFKLLTRFYKHKTNKPHLYHTNLSKLLNIFEDALTKMIPLSANSPVEIKINNRFYVLEKFNTFDKSGPMWLINKNGPITSFFVSSNTLVEY